MINREAKIGAVYPPGIRKLFGSDNPFLSLLSFIVATAIPKEISNEVALEMMANCLNPPIDARIKHRLAYTIMET